MARYPTDDKQLVFVKYGGMPSAPFRNRPRHLRLRPVGRLQVEDDEIG